MEIAALLFLIVWVLDGNPQRSEKIRFDLAQKRWRSGCTSRPNTYMRAAP
jgi:hypothetical protein